MSAWTTDELETIDAVDEVQVASRRTDGSLRPFATIWAARAGDDIYVRSARGPSNRWFRRAVSSGEGRLRGGGVERDVTFELSGGAVNAMSIVPTTPSTTATVHRWLALSSNRKPPRRRYASCPVEEEARQGRWP